MDKGRILEEIRTDLSEAMKTLSADNMDVLGEKFNAYCRLLEVMNMPIIDEGASSNQGTQEPIDIDENIDLENGIEPSAEFDDYAVNPPLPAGCEDEDVVKGELLERQLVGGTLASGIWVSEAILRNLQAGHGDYVYAEHTGVIDGKDRYHFELVEQGNGKGNQAIEEFPFGILEYRSDISSYVVSENIYSQSLRVDEAPMSLTIDKGDIDRLGLRTGDVVDIAWYKNNPKSVKIRWVHKNMDYCGAKIGKGLKVV